MLSSNEAITRLPLSALVLSDRNTRRTGGKDVTQLAASIAAHGLLQNLTVENIKNGFGVIAGGRRLRALQLLASENRLPADCAEGIWCRVETDPARILEISTAENTVREPMHPHDEFVAFRDMAADGHGTETIAARFGVTPLVVERRLRLANVSPVLLRLFREDKLNIEQMMALAITDDHAAQERVWKNAEFDHQRRPDALRASLTQGEVSTTDRRVKFVGLEDYEAAGGPVHRDLFRAEHYITDTQLLDRLVEQRLDTVKADLEAEGWSFVRISLEADWNFVYDCSRSEGKQQLTEEQQKELDSLNEAIEHAVAAANAYAETLGEDEFDDESDRLDDEVSAARQRAAGFRESCVVFSDRQKAKSGAFAWLDTYGELRIERGLIPKSGSATKAARDSSNPTSGSPAADAPKPPPTLSQAMLTRFSAHRTLALRAELVKRADVSLAVLAHALLLPLLFDPMDQHQVDQPLEVLAKPAQLHTLGYSDVDGAETAAQTLAAIADLRKTLRVPTKAKDFLNWLLNQSRDTVVGLMAAVPALTLDAVDRLNSSKSKAVAIADALELNMADHWQPTAETFFGIAPKAIAIEAVREVHGDLVAGRLDGMKKDELVAKCTELMHRTGWLPKSLRRPGYALNKGCETETAAPKAAKAPAKTAPAKKASKPAAKKGSSKQKAKTRKAPTPKQAAA